MSLRARCVSRREPDAHSRFPESSPADFKLHTGSFIGTGAVLGTKFLRPRHFPNSADILSGRKKKKMYTRGDEPGGESARLNVSAHFAAWEVIAIALEDAGQPTHTSGELTYP